MGFGIDKVIGNYKPVMTNEDDPVEIVQDEEPGEEKPGAPEWIRNPGVKVIVIPWRRIICDNRRAFLIVIIVYYRWVRLGWAFSVLARTPRQNR
jgi:hypothetical protein